MTKWIIATFKINEVARLEFNLKNQKIDYYLPKIFIKKLNADLKEELMFPGYIFLNMNNNDYGAIKYTKGIKKILKFGTNVPYMKNNDIEAIIKIEHISKKNPSTVLIDHGQEVLVKSGSFKGNLAKICSSPSNKRIDILIHILGSKREVNVSINDLTLL